MEAKHVVVLLPAVAGDLPVGPPQEIEEGQERELVLLAAEGGLAYLVGPHPHAVALLEELEVVLIQEEDLVTLVDLLPELPAEHVPHAHHPLAVAVRRQHPQTGLLEWPFC